MGHGIWTKTLGNMEKSGEVAGYGNAVELATNVVKRMRHPDAEWFRKEGNQWKGKRDPVNLPPHGYTWGNKYMYPSLSLADFETLITANGRESIIFKWREGETTFYVLSVWQSNQVCQYNVYYSPC